jgi:hypothetical protein
MTTKNIHVPELYHMIVRFLVEMQLSQSANTSINNDFDLARYKTYFNALRVKIGVMKHPSFLDLPETDPFTFELRPLPAIKDVENEVVAQLSLFMRAMALELTRSQTARNSSGIVSFDRTRQLALVSECETYLTDYAMKVQPLDLPETSPRAPLQGPGLDGLGE